jgi:hypothetical protein
MVGYAHNRIKNGAQEMNAAKNAIWAASVMNAVLPGNKSRISFPNAGGTTVSNHTLPALLHRLKTAPRPQSSEMLQKHPYFDGTNYSIFFRRCQADIGSFCTRT